MKLENAVNKMERKKLQKALNRQQKTAEKNKPQREKEIYGPPLTSTVNQHHRSGVVKCREEAFENASRIDVTNNDTLAFDKEDDDTVVVNRNHAGTPKLDFDGTTGLMCDQKPSPPIVKSTGGQ